MALAAERASADDLAESAEAYAAMAAADPAGDTAIEADLRFHRAILAAGHNDLLLQMGNLIGLGLVITYRISSDTYIVFLPLHKAVLDAMPPGTGRRPAGDGAAARGNPRIPGAADGRLDGNGQSLISGTDCVAPAARVAADQRFRRQQVARHPVNWITDFMLRCSESGG